MRKHYRTIEKLVILSLWEIMEIILSLWEIMDKVIVLHVKE